MCLSLCVCESICVYIFDYYLQTHVFLYTNTYMYVCYFVFMVATRYKWSAQIDRLIHSLAAEHVEWCNKIIF